MLKIAAAASFAIAILQLARGAAMPAQQIVFSLVSLAIGILYLVGTARRWSFIYRRSS